jgi:transcriptional regulator with XRE-family HTH domain
MNGSDLPPGALPVVRINGEKIRQLREAKGLTQLYVATSVEVTTDTISRWENRRYPTIKKENALKLAEALEVTLADIEDNTPPAEEPVSVAPALSAGVAPEVAPPARRWPLLALILGLGLLAICLAAWYLLGSRRDGTVTAHRFLPAHAAPGEIFPVLIQVRSADPQSRSLIVKETLPAGCEQVKGMPAVNALDQQRRFLKWISTAPPGKTTFAYLAKVLPNVAMGAKLDFEGNITLHKGIGGASPVLGGATLEVKGLHWADANGDLVLDDEEILAVYTLFDATEGLDIDKETIDGIWSGSGYKWDPSNRRFIALP